MLQRQGRGIGAMRERITIQSRDETTRDSMGGHDLAWTAVVTVWARVDHLKGRELWAARMFVSEATRKFTIRYRTGLDESMRVVYDGANYNVIEIQDSGRNDYLVIIATTGSLITGE